MAETTALSTQELTITSLAKALMALNEGHPLTIEQKDFFQQAAHAERTWNPLKQKDLVPVSEILDVEESSEAVELEGKAWDKNFSAVQRIMLQNLDLKLKAMARQLIAKARNGMDASELVPKGNSVWEKRACELLRSTLQLVQREGG